MIASKLYVPWCTLREAIEEANTILEGSDLPQIPDHRDFPQRRLAEAMRLAL
jgi:CSLREA domain-containing protein